MREEGSISSIRLRRISGAPVPSEIEDLVRVNGSAMLGHGQKKNLSVRYGRYCIAITTDLGRGEMDGVEGVRFTIGIIKRRKNGRKPLQTVMVMVIDRKSSRSTATKDGEDQPPFVLRRPN